MPTKQPKKEAIIPEARKSEVDTQGAVTSAGYYPQQSLSQFK
jgi:hypothetical protein